MVDIASLGIEVNSSPVEQATTRLSGFSAAARGAQAANDSFGASARQSASATNSLSAAAANEVAALQASTAAVRLNAAAHNAQAASLRGAAFQSRNLVFQLNDVFVSLASGMNPLMVAIQQGSQISQIYGAQQGGIGAAFRETGRLMGGFVARVPLLTAAFVAAGAAVAGFYFEINRTSNLKVGFLDTIKAMVDVLVSSIYNELKPAIDAISPWFLAAFDKVAEGTRVVGNTIINSFKAAFSDLRFMMAAFPTVVALGIDKSVNAVLDGVSHMLNEALSLLNSFIDKINAAVTGMIGPHSGINRIEPFNESGGRNIVTFDGKPFNAKASEEALKIANEAHRKAVEKILGGDPMGDYAAAVKTDAVANAVAGMSKELKGASDAYESLLKSAEQRNKQMQLEIGLVGQVGAAAETLRYETGLINTATEAWNKLTEQQKLAMDSLGKGIDDQVASIHKLAVEYGVLVEQLKLAKLQDDLMFERRQLFRSPLDQSIAGRLRSAGRPEDLTSSEANFIRDNARFVELKDGIRGFFDEFQAGLTRGDDFGKALGAAILKALNNVLDKSLDKLFDSLSTSLASMIMGPMAGLSPAAAAGTFLESGGGLMGMLFGTGPNTPATAAKLLGGLGSPLGNAISGSGGANALAGGSIRDVITAAATKWGVDPSVAIRVALKEGGLTNPFRQGEAMLSYGREESFGPFQLHMRNGGVGVRALAAGIDPRTNWQGGVDFAMKEASEKGWGQWFGAKNAGVSNWEGIGKSTGAALGQLTQGAKASASATAALSSASADAAKGAGSLTNSFTGLSQTLGGAFPAAPGGGGGGIGGFFKSLFGGGGGGLPSFDFMNAISPAATDLILSGGAGLFHGGGIAGQASAYRYLDPLTFMNARRYHRGGLATDEVPAILQRGERILPRGSNSNGNVSVNVYPLSGETAKVTQKKKPDGSMQVDVVLDKIVAEKLERRGSEANRVLQSSYGLSKAMVRR